MGEPSGSNNDNLVNGIKEENGSGIFAGYETMEELTAVSFNI